MPEGVGIPAVTKQDQRTASPLNERQRRLVHEYLLDGDKRRAQHKASTPRLNECPRCHSPRLPHRVCPTCGTYAGREVIAHKVAEASATPATDSE